MSKYCVAKFDYCSDGIPAPSNRLGSIMYYDDITSAYAKFIELQHDKYLLFEDTKDGYFPMLIVKEQKHG